MKLVSAAMGVAALTLALPLWANSISNPGFETGSGSANFSGLGSFSSPATSWAGWNNIEVATNVELLPTTLPLQDAGNQMLHISSTGEGNGVFQFFDGGSYAGAWFFVNSGSAALWMAQGATSTQYFTTQQGQWEFVQNTSPFSANEITLYTGTDGGDFYVDLVSAESAPITPETLPQSTPEPASLSLALVGAAGMFVAARRRATNAG